ncbi:UvrD-helicase domain-containing protein [Clostridium ihumii]|uniref:UvrD-helicase domain-containing protein n=1 Tax=Clostridium ihumii TaxID=1470356 RepID=UPI00058B955A|nr:ATP-dependent helicase [Clostridium ihumii]
MIINADMYLDIEKEFKIEAGPGAGKTRFLVNHINNVMKNSERLYSSRKVACITYTNTAVETILERLGEGASLKTEVSTIHSFLYNNIVKPYSSFIPEEYEVSSEKLNGHDDPMVNGSIARKWIENGEFDDLKNPNTKNQILKLPQCFAALKSWLITAKCTESKGNIEWVFDNTKAVDYENDKGTGIKKSNLDILKSKFIEYKKFYWRSGILDHEDVLFFSAVLIQKYPFILSVLRAKYPYFFIDEFQDTSPIQSYIINEIRKDESIIGIIGDKAQSIYGFSGAEVKLFNGFKIKKDCKHTIKENHRSDKMIVDLLNKIRSDLEQVPQRSYVGSVIKLYIGDRNKAFNRAQALCGEETLYSLSRDNITSNIMKARLEGTASNNKLFDKLDRIDSNSQRKEYIISFIKSVELARNQNFKEALKKIEWIYKSKPDTKKIALEMLSYALNYYTLYSQKSLMEFYLILSKHENCFKLSGFRNGAIKDLYNDTPYMDMALCVNIIEDKSKNITIHKAKGAEYENVFIIGNKQLLSMLVNPDLESEEEQRIFYVALSRAEKRLFFQLDELSDEDEKIIHKKYRFSIERI